MQVINYNEIEFSILEDTRNDLTIFSFYEREPNSGINNELYEIKFEYCYGINYSEQELLDIIKSFNI